MSIIHRLIASAENNSAVRIVPTNLEDKFNAVKDPIIVNMLPTLATADANLANEIVRGKIGTEILPSYSACECRSLKYGYRANDTCSVCGGKVQIPFTPVFNYRTWIKAHAQSAPFIHTGFWLYITGFFTFKKRSFFDWLVYASDESGAQIKKEFAQILADIEPFFGGKVYRNWNWVCANFEMLVKTLSRHPKFIKNFREVDVEKIFDVNRDRIYTRYLPTLHPSAYAIESGGRSLYMDTGMTEIAAITKSFLGIEAPDNVTRYTLTQIQNKTAACQVKYTRAFVHCVTEIAKKPGAIRQGLTSMRFHFNIRAVISGKSRDLDYERIEIAWVHAIKLFRLHLINKLYKRGYAERSAKSLLREAALQYHPLIDELFTELIEDAKRELGLGGIPVGYIRYPSLSAMSNRFQVIGGVKRDIVDQSITMSNGIVVPFNADYDGDQMVVIWLPDKEFTAAFKGLAHETSVLDPSRPFCTEGITGWPVQVSINVAGAISHEYKFNSLLLNMEDIAYMDSIPTV